MEQHTSLSQKTAQETRTINAARREQVTEGFQLVGRIQNTGDMVDNGVGELMLQWDLYYRQEYTHNGDKVCGMFNPTQLPEEDRPKDSLNCRLEKLNEMDWRGIHSQLPTEQDITNQTERIEASIHREIEGTRWEVVWISLRVDAIEQHGKDLSNRIENMQQTQKRFKNFLIQQQLMLDDLVNRNRGNNIKIKGVSEMVTNRELPSLVTRIWNSFMDRPQKKHLETDRAHRIFRSTRGKKDKESEVLCRIHL